MRGYQYMNLYHKYLVLAQSTQNNPSLNAEQKARIWEEDMKELKTLYDCSKKYA